MILLIYALYLKKAGLASRNIVYPPKNILRRVGFCLYIFQFPFAHNSLCLLRWPTTVTAKEITSRRKGKPHGKRKRLTAKEITSRQKEKDSRQKEKTHGKKKRLTAKRKTSRQKEKDSRQKEKPHGKRKRLTAKVKVSRQKEKPHGK